MDGRHEYTIGALCIFIFFSELHTYREMHRLDFLSVALRAASLYNLHQ